jgi:hypothetical protein
MASWWDNLVGSDNQIEKVQTQTPQVQQLLAQLGQILGPALQNQSGFLGQQQSQNYSAGAPQAFNFAPIAREARQNFMSETLPSLAERFNAVGAFGGSGFRNAALGQSKLLDQNLASQQAKYDFLGNQQNAQNYYQGAQLGQNERGQQLAALQNLLSSLLGTQQFANVTKQGQIGLLPSVLPTIANAGIGYALGGPTGALTAIGGQFAKDIARS